MKVIKGKKKRRTWSILLPIAIAALAVYIIVMIVNQQIQIGQKSQELAELTAELDAQNVKNEELQATLEAGMDQNDDYVERVARESLDYTKPGEKVFVNIAGE